MPYTVLDPALAAAAPVVLAGAPLGAGSKSLVQMRSYVQDAMGGRTDITAKVDEFINKSYRWLFSNLHLPQENFSFSFSTVVGQPFYLLPSQTRVTRKVSVSDEITYFTEGRPLRRVDLDGFRRLPVAEGPPERFLEYEYADKKFLALWPSPLTIKTIAVEGVLDPVLLTAEAHVPILPYDWHEVIEEAALARAFKFLREWTSYTVTWMHVKALIREKKSERAQKNEGALGGFWRPRSRTDLEYGVRNVINPDSDESF